MRLIDFVPSKIYIFLSSRPWLSDEKFIRMKFKKVFSRELNLNNPTSFNEKLQWIKLYDRNPLYTTMVDKYLVKQYVGNIIGDEYIIKTYGVWNSFDEIDFEKLPEQFVLKTTHDSGGLVICKNKKSFNFKMARKKIQSSLRNNYYLHAREWPYKNVKPRIIAEEYMEDHITHELRDYKFFCFNGEMKLMFIVSNRYNSDMPTTMDYFDRNFNKVDLTWGSQQSSNPPAKPELFEDMVKLAEKLSIGLSEVRVDFYIANNKIYFGELTFFDGSGFTEIKPYEWDVKLGSYIKLNINRGLR